MNFCPENYCTGDKIKIISYATTKTASVQQKGQSA